MFNVQHNGNWKKMYHVYVTRAQSTFTNIDNLPWTTKPESMKINQEMDSDANIFFTPLYKLVLQLKNPKTSLNILNSVHILLICFVGSVR